MSHFPAQIFNKAVNCRNGFVLRFTLIGNLIQAVPKELCGGLFGKEQSRFAAPHYGDEFRRRVFRISIKIKETISVKCEVCTLPNKLNSIFRPFKMLKKFFSHVFTATFRSYLKMEFQEKSKFQLNTVKLFPVKWTSMSACFSSASLRGAAPQLRSRQS